MVGVGCRLGGSVVLSVWGLRFVFAFRAWLTRASGRDRVFGTLHCRGLRLHCFGPGLPDLDSTLGCSTYEALFKLLVVGRNPWTCPANSMSWELDAHKTCGNFESSNVWRFQP